MKDVQIRVRSMIRIQTVKAPVSLILAVTFLVFNIGLPIVVASCPMAQDPYTATCKQCLPLARPAAQAVERQFNRSSCCATVIAAGRNTTEFLPLGKLFATFYSLTLTPTPGINDVVPTFSVVTTSALIHPPPRAEDIPIFNASLLI